MQKATLPKILPPLLAVLLYIAAGCASQSKEPEYNAAADNAAAATANAASDEITYPHTIRVGERYVIVHPPQIRSWEDFEVMEGIAVVELVPVRKEPPRFGVVSFTADASPDLAARTVALTNIQMASLTEDDAAVPADVRKLFAEAFPNARTVPLDLVLSYLAEGVIPGTTAGIKSEPPKVFFSQGSAILVLLHGEPVWAPIKDSKLTFAANTNWPLFKGESGKLYLNHDDTWLSADKVAGPWAWTDTLTNELKNLPEDGNWKSSKKAAAEWTRKPKFPPPRVFTSTTPAELILLLGKPQLVAIADTGIEYVANTEVQLFKIADNWYYLVSGRWFTSTALASSWKNVTKLPQAFAAIPADHEKADVLAMVPNTPQAKMAALDTLVPKKNRIPVNSGVPAEVSYSGEPAFERIEGTGLSYAKNTNYDILEFAGKYYLCYSGVWYIADSAIGPWLPARTVPAEIYDIPPSSPVYHTTYVKVYDTSPTHVTYGYTGGYHHTYIYYGVPVYGSGWYYPPYSYYYGGYPIYHGYPYTYGSGSYYNSRTGSYGSVSRAYGPYGGWGYASGYNPSSGTYGRAEVWYDYDEWHAAGQAYNPSTGRYVESSRHYDADNNAWATSSTLQSRRGDVSVDRHFDANYGTANITTSAGGQGTFTRRASDGGWDTSGSYTTGDGRTIDTAGRYEQGEGSSALTGSRGGQGTIERSVGSNGVTREGSFSRDGQTIDTNTSRSGRNVATQIETSEGGKGVVAGRGTDRTAIGQSSSGDIYAGRDGSVYKRTDDGWSKRDGDNWTQMDNPRSGDSRTERQNQNRSSSQGSGSARDQAAASTRDRSTNSSRSGSDYSRSSQNRQNSLNRDSAARQRGQSRSRDFSAGRGRSGGGRARGGGGRRR